MVVQVMSISLSLTLPVLPFMIALTLLFFSLTKELKVSPDNFTIRDAAALKREQTSAIRRDH